MERLGAIVRVLPEREPAPSMVMVDAQTVAPLAAGAPDETASRRPALIVAPKGDSSGVPVRSAGCELTARTQSVSGSGGTEQTCKQAANGDQKLEQARLRRRTPDIRQRSTLDQALAPDAPTASPVPRFGTGTKPMGPARSSSVGRATCNWSWRVR
jgi:hypothetical protein